MNGDLRPINPLMGENIILMVLQESPLFGLAALQDPELFGQYLCRSSTMDLSPPITETIESIFLSAIKQLTSCFRTDLEETQ